MIDKQLLQKRFSKSATSYDQYANVQKEMALVLVEWAAQIDAEKSLNSSWEGNTSILEVGCGTGYLTQKLHSLWPKANIVAVDIAQGMIEVAQERLSHPQIQFVCADIEEIELAQSFDLIISNAPFNG